MLPHHRHLSQQSRQRLGVSVEQKKHYQRAKGRKTKSLVLWQKKYKLRIVMNKKKTGRKATKLTEEEKQWIVDNLDRANLTYVNPGRKDHVYIGKKDGERQYC